MIRFFGWLLILAVLCDSAPAQQPPYDNAPSVSPPYYRVRYEACNEPGKLIFPVTYTVWIPPTAETLRGVIVHQHGCGEGSCKSGQTGAFDWHWQALASKHQCALLASSYEQPGSVDCQMWCDPRNGSDEAFQTGLEDLGKLAGHDELARVPWALWGRSGGGHWAGGMLMLHPERVAAVWLRSGVPLFEANPKRSIQPHTINPAVAEVPVMCNFGVKEGVKETSGRSRSTMVGLRRCKPILRTSSRRCPRASFKANEPIRSGCPANWSLTHGLSL